MRIAPPKTNMGPENIPVRPKRKGNGTGGGFPKPVKSGTPAPYGGGPKKTMMANGGVTKKIAPPGTGMGTVPAKPNRTKPKGTFGTVVTGGGAGTTGGKPKVIKPRGNNSALVAGLGASLLGNSGPKKTMMAKGGMTKKGKK